jgi:hypothetical protein
MRSDLTNKEFFEIFAQTFASFAVNKELKIISVLLVVLSLIPVHAYGQTEKLSEKIIEIAEDLANDEADPEAASTYIERLSELAENPVKMNSSPEDEISRLFFLSDFQVKALADYIHSSGRIVSVYELANIPGFDREVTEMMIPFISLDSNLNLNSDSVNLRNTFLSNVSIRSGNSDTTLSGSQWKILTKYKFTAGSISGGFTSEKDPGEKFLNGTPPLPDFLSANLTYSGNGLIRKLIIGDFSARFGQGTNINTGIRTGLSLTASGYMSASDEIKPYTSTNENNFFRGIAAEIAHKNLELFLFFSNNNIDATLGSLSGLKKDYIENFYLAGIHNTSSLLLKKDVVSEQVIGINLSYNFKNLRTGLLWSEDKFSLPVIQDDQNPEDIFSFSGDRNNLYTLYYNSLIKRILFYGELSVNENNKYAFVQGSSFRPSDRLTINFLYRNYDAGYTSFHGKSPGISSSTGNEQGILGNFTFEAVKHLFISGGSDFHHFQWLRYRCSAPSWGVKQEIRVRFLPSEKITTEASYIYRLSMVDNMENNGIPDQIKSVTRSLKGSFRYTISENLSLGTRIDYKIVSPSGSNGMLILQDLNYSLRQIPVTIWLRYCLYNTNDWDSRIYTYENDLLYSFSIPALSGVGSRSYFMANWKIFDFAELRVKYGITSLNESGTFPVNKDEFKIQLKAWF